MKEGLTGSNPVKPAAPYLGGKRNLAKEIVQRINQIDHSIYAEPFVGMGGIFFRRDMIPRSEVINDLNREIFNFYRILQRHYTAFMDHMRFCVTSRAEFERLSREDPDTLTEIERAARFLYLQRLAFGGKVSGRNFGVSPDRPARFNITTLADDLDALHTRLAGVVLECLSYDEFIRRYDRAGTLFYLDPPYFGCENDYGQEMFSRADFQKLAEQLGALKGSFLLSINDVPEIRETFKDFDMMETELNYSVAKASGKRAQELIISNGV